MNDNDNTYPVVFEDKKCFTEDKEQSEQGMSHEVYSIAIRCRTGLKILQQPEPIQDHTPHAKYCKVTNWQY